MGKAGMDWKEGRDRVERMVRSKKGHPEAKRNYCNSVLNQVRTRHGQSAVDKILAEYVRTK